VSVPAILTVYRYVFAGLIVVASAQTLLAAGLEHPHIGLLASAEIAGALLLIWRRAAALGACVLLVVFASAQVMAAMEAEWPTRFLQYAASTLVIVTLDRALKRARAQ
jgi:hypothetical protein